LIILHISRNPLIEYPELPDDIKYLSINRTFIRKINELPFLLIRLECTDNCQLTELPILPPFIEGIELHNTPIKSLKSYSQKITKKKVNIDVEYIKYDRFNFGVKHVEYIDI
jgi:hypothetical protein